MISIDRTARMYPLMMNMELLQVLFLIRCQKTGRVVNWGACSIFGALAIAAHYTAALLLVSEALRLAAIFVAKRRYRGLAQLWLVAAGRGTGRVRIARSHSDLHCDQRF
jgi:uncharacterized membrane protein